MSATAVHRVGVVGAGTMGAGIAEVSAVAGFATVLCDPVEGAAERGADGLARSLERAVARGKVAADDAAQARARVTTTQALDDLFGCDVVIEAAPEDLALKQGTFAALDAGCAPGAILATNTSSIPVTAIAAAAVHHPGRVVGLHFFNPVPVMRLAEVIAAEQTAPQTVAATLALADRLGKQRVLAADTPGFLVNRCGRPFYTEALRVVTERLATPVQVDRICRIGGGFRMGPFELMDLVGTDVALDVMQSFAARSFGEPRWRPSPLHARLVAAGRLGRKSGHGWYAYAGEPHRADAPPAPEPRAAGLSLRIAGSGPVAARLRTLAGAAGATIADDGDTAVIAFLADEAAGAPDAAAVRVRCCEQASLTGHGDAAAVGFALGPGDGFAEVGATRTTRPAAVSAAREALTALGLHVEVVGDGPGLVLRRILAQVVNEGCFAVGEGVGSAADVDAGVTLGLNYPRGPIGWGRTLGFDGVAGTLDALWRERREERYRAAPLLAEAAVAGDVNDV